MSEVTFRRIRGRIVPIKKKNNVVEISKGAIMAGVGSAIAVGGAVAAAGLMVKSKALFTASKSFAVGGNIALDLGRDALVMSRLQKSAKLYRRGNKFISTAKWLLPTSLGFGSTVANAGINEMEDGKAKTALRFGVNSVLPVAALTTSSKLQFKYAFPFIKGSK